jgi:hypothetical protein
MSEKCQKRDSNPATFQAPFNLERCARSRWGGNRFITEAEMFVIGEYCASAAG